VVPRCERMVLKGRLRIGHSPRARKPTEIAGPRTAPAAARDFRLALARRVVVHIGLFEGLERPLAVIIN
jgi:hypothetical protein